MAPSYQIPPLLLIALNLGLATFGRVPESKTNEILRRWMRRLGVSLAALSVLTSSALCGALNLEWFRRPQVSTAVLTAA